jgi:hypothetical protein
MRSAPERSGLRFTGTSVIALARAAMSSVVVLAPHSPQMSKVNPRTSATRYG